jgi:hypothetical protein
MEGVIMSDLIPDINSSVESVFPYQLNYSQSNTPAMQARGDLIRNRIPGLFRKAAESNRIPNVSLIPDLFIEGSDGKGNKNYVPWVRFASESLSPSARIGWYITFLFSTDGSSVWLVIAHASTSEGGKSISKEVRQKLKEWGLSKLPSLNDIDTELSASIDLNSRGPGLGDKFESTSLFGFQFKQGNVPSTTRILEKINLLLPHLKTLYDAELNDPSMPSAEPIELKAAEEVIDEIAGKVPKARKYSGQGTRGTYEERRAIERRAVDLAIEYFGSTNDWETIKDTGSNQSYDLLLTNKNKKLYVEVKGTQSRGEKVFLTKNEVKVHKKFYPNNALFVVSGIKLIKGDLLIASGGEIRVIYPWKIKDSNLIAMAYEYEVPEP